MILRPLSALFVVALLTGCPMSDKKSEAAKAKDPNAAKKPTRDESHDVAFQGFVGRLRTAVQSRDVAVLSSMMAPDFGYRWDAPGEGETPFSFWDKNNLWGELASLLKDHWVPHDGFMVVPPQFAVNFTPPPPPAAGAVPAVVIAPPKATLD